MRTKKSFINLITSFGSQIIIILLGFISRRVLIYSVGVEYLGINGLMTNILTIFSLAESGIGLVIGYNLYKPLAENDTELIKSLMKFYKKTYNFLAIFTVLIGILFYPFLPFFLKGNTAENVNIIYFLFLFNSASSYLFSYKATLNNSDQNKYLFTITNVISQIFILVIKVLILYFKEDYILFLSVDILTNLIKNIIFSIIVDKKYPYLKDKNVKKLDNNLKKNMFENISALLITKIGYIVSESSDNLVISAFVSINSLGMYSNYTTIISAVRGFVSLFTSSITSSMGNLIVSEDVEKSYRIYKIIDFINNWMYTFCSVAILCLMEPFIELWIGKDFILSKFILITSVMLFYIKGENSSIEMVKNAAGLFKPDRYVTLIEAVTNLFVSMLLASRYGIVGVVLGTLISYVILSYWIRGFVVYKHLFKKSFLNHIVHCFKHMFIFVLCSIVIYNTVLYIEIRTNLFLNFLLKAVVIFVFTNLLLLLINIRNHDFKEVYKIALNKIQNK